MIHPFSSATAFKELSSPHQEDMSRVQTLPPFPSTKRSRLAEYIYQKHINDKPIEEQPNDCGFNHQVMGVTTRSIPIGASAIIVGFIVACPLKLPLWTTVIPPISAIWCWCGVSGCLIHTHQKRIQDTATRAWVTQENTLKEFENMHRIMDKFLSSSLKLIVIEYDGDPHLLTLQAASYREIYLKYEARPS